MRTSICTSFVVALVFLVASPCAFAQDAASVAAPAPAPVATPEPVTAPVPVAAPASIAAPARGSEPGWSLGAGVSMPFLGGVTSIIVSPSSAGVSVSPGAVASLERRLAPSTWLVLGVDAFYLRNRRDAPPAWSSGYTHQDHVSVGASAGIRQQVTGARAPVAVSILALAEGGWVDQEDRDVSSFGDIIRTTGSGWAAGASLGLAIERDLTTNLALRLATPLLFASYTETRSETNGGGDYGASSVKAGVALAPSLQLRLYF